jgi:hypothetical protein
MNEEPASPSTDLLYHYTDQHGLVGIIERLELWATNLGCLGDLSEFAHGLDYLRNVRNDIIDNLLCDRPRDSAETKSFRAVFEYLMSEAERRYSRKDPAEYLYAFSLFDSSRSTQSGAAESDPGDNLEQWRAYSKGGFGYCIGFDKKVLESKVEELNGELQRTFCGECMYDSVEKLKSATKILNALVPACELAVATAYPRTDAGGVALESAPQCLDHESGQARATREKVPSASGGESAKLNHSEARELILGALSTYFGRILINSALMKHVAFATEREWRVVRLAFTLSREIRFRSTTKGIIPFAAIPIRGSENPDRITPGLIKRIVVGPMGDASREAKVRAASIVRMLLENNGIEVAGSRGEAGVVIENSKLPC